MIDLGLTYAELTTLGERQYTIPAHLINDYSHEIRAQGGFWSAKVDLGLTTLDALDWMMNGLGRRIEVSSNGSCAWRGFVNAMTLTLSGFTWRRGPLLDIANRVIVSYAALDTSNPYHPGEHTLTTVANNVASQDKYGIIERVLSAGSVTSVDAVAIRDAYLAECSRVPDNKSLTLGGSSNATPNVILECLGVQAWLTTYTYAEAGTGTQNLSTKLQAVLAASGGRFSSDYTQITPNTLAVSKYEAGDRAAFEIVRELVSFGDAVTTRYTWGFYEHDVFAYTPILSNIPTYYYRVGENGVLWNAQLASVPIALVRPGKWLSVTDMDTLSQGVVEMNDPKATFIEALNFQAPNRLMLSSAPVSSISQKLAQLGLSGMGV